MNDATAANPTTVPTGKTVRLLLALASAGIAAATTPGAYAQGSFKTDTAGNLTTGSTLNLGNPGISGTLAPARLGTGTPSSTTVLRGDGSWVGTTPTGSTVAATGSLLMGDGAGNAVAAASADLARVLKTRLEIRKATDVFPVNLLAGATPSGPVNSDQTITVPANGRVYWAIPNPGTAATTYYGYIVATTEAAAGAASLHLNLGYDVPGSDSTLAPGVYRSTFTGTNNGGLYVDLNNTTNAPLTVYFPFLSTVDGGLSFLQSGADFTPVATQPVADLDFTRFVTADRSGRYLAERQTTIAADSVTGNDASAGTLYAPRLALAQTLTNGSVLGLYRGSLFRDSLPFSALSTPHGIVAMDVALGSQKPLPMVSALDAVGSGDFNDNDDGTFSYLWTPTNVLVNDGYSNVYVVEISTATEAVQPVAARRRMTDATSQSAVIATAGAVWVQSPGTGAGQSGSATQWKITLHPTGESAPRDHVFHYEVVSRTGPALFPSQSVGDAALSGLELVGSSNGYGSLSGPTGFVGDRLALLHCSTHNAVLGGGSLQRSVFYELGDGQSIQLAWYTPTATGLRWTMSDCLFYANVGDRAANCLIAHTGGSTSYDRGDIAACAFLGARWADNSLHGTAIDYVNVNAGLIERVYVQAIQEIFGFNLPLASEVKNSVFRQVGRARVGDSFHDNIVAAESVADPASPANAPTALLLQQNGASATNNLLWARGVPGSTAGNGEQVVGLSLYPGVASGSAVHNIMVLDPATAQTASNYFQGQLPAGIAFDDNLIICTGAFRAGGTQNNFSWAAYQANNPTLDVHSLFVDLSGDPRGLRAVFADPANGDFRWAQTEVARRCAAYCRANNVGPAAVTSRWPVVPSVDDAVRSLTDL